MKRDELQAFFDEFLNTDAGNVTSIRGIIRDELNTKLTEIKDNLMQVINTKFNSLKAENETITQENQLFKKALCEQQLCLERMQRKQNINNIFVSGLPNALTMDMSKPPEDEDTVTGDIVDDHTVILQHVLEFVHPGIATTDYKILKNFDPREGYSRHSVKIKVHNLDTKKLIFNGCKKLKDVERDSYIKNVFLKYDDPPLTRKEHDRLYQKMKALREEEADPRNPVNKYHIKAGKLFRNGNDCIDEFNIDNQLF